MIFITWFSKANANYTQPPHPNEKSWVHSLCCTQTIHGNPHTSQRFSLYRHPNFTSSVLRVKTVHNALFPNTPYFSMQISVRVKDTKSLHLWRNSHCNFTVVIEGCYWFDVFTRKVGQNAGYRPKAPHFVWFCSDFISYPYSTFMALSCYTTWPTHLKPCRYKPKNQFNRLTQRFPTFLTRGALFRINFYGGAPCLPYVLQVNGV